jgi:hypothetical protein
MSGSRREGTSLATVGALHPETQLVTVRDKYKIPVPMPVSTELIERLVAHAIERGGEGRRRGKAEREGRRRKWDGIGEGYGDNKAVRTDM